MVSDSKKYTALANFVPNLHQMVLFNYDGAIKYATG